MLVLDKQIKHMTEEAKNLKAVDVGHYFICLANQQKKQITNKKLQKLVYYAQVWSLTLYDKKLYDEPIEAWVHGPAIRSLYNQYKKFGFDPIKEEVESGELEKIPAETKQLLNRIWKIYGSLDAGYLEMLTHSEEPWQKAREGLQDHESSHNEISPNSIKIYYVEKLKEARAK